MGAISRQEGAKTGLRFEALPAADRFIFRGRRITNYSIMPVLC